MTALALTDSLVPQLEALELRLDRARSLAGKLHRWGHDAMLSRADREERYAYLRARAAQEIGRTEASGRRVGPIKAAAIAMLDGVDLTTR